VYAEPLPLIVEVWSPSTGAEDVETKLRAYQWRGDREILRIHPCEKTLTSWRRQPEGSDIERRYDSGKVQATSLPNLAIDLESLFE
jgi:Uma2 family endonuclease